MLMSVCCEGPEIDENICFMTFSPSVYSLFKRCSLSRKLRPEGPSLKFSLIIDVLSSDYLIKDVLSLTADLHKDGCRFSLENFPLSHLKSHLSSLLF